MFLWKRYLRDLLMVFGVVLWVGAHSPEIFMQSGVGCILDENGEELTAEDAQEFMEDYFYGDSVKDTTVEIRYKFAFMELFK